MLAHNDRQGFLGPNHENVLGRYRIAVVGAGGGGSHFTQQLAHIGIGTVCVFDPDFMTEGNQNREVGSTEKDIVERTLKVDIAERLMKGIRPSTNVMKIPYRWQERAEILRDCHVVFGCLDSFSDRAELEVSCRRYMQPLIDIGMDVHSVGDEYAIAGQVILSMPGSLCMRCVGFIQDDILAKEAARYGKAGPRPQVVWPNGILASAAIGVFMQLVTPWHKKHTSTVYLEYDGNAQTLLPSNRLVAVRGHVCSHFTKCQSIGDPFWNPESVVVDQSIQNDPVETFQN
jgi:molybdopterin-synthase adenylyltransferase